MEDLFEEDLSFGWPDCVFEERAALRSDCSLSVKKRPGTDVAVEEVLIEETLQRKLGGLEKRLPESLMYR